MASALPEPPPHFKKSAPREYLESVVVAVILALFIRTFVVQAFKIPTGSMETNLLIGDHLLVNKVVYSPSLGSFEAGILPKRPIRRGDIVVFKFPEDPTRDFIKRVIGLPGESVEIHDKTVIVDGKALDEPYARFIDAPLRPDDPEYGLRA
jgi:signal peptidase I